MGGTGALVGALGDLLERLGGRLVLEADVERVLVADGRAVGVQLADSTTVRGGRRGLQRRSGIQDGSLLSGEPRARPARARMRQARQSMSLHVLYFGADKTWPDSPLAHHNMLFARDQRAALRRVFPSRILGFPRPARNDDVPAADDMFLYVHMPTRTDPSVAPAGCEALYVLVATPARLEPGSDPPGEQARVRAAVLDVLDRKYLPGLAEHIVVEHAIGPEHFRDVLNSPQGAAFSLQPTLFQSGWFRPHNRSRAVRGLYLVGAGTHPGAGVPAVLASGKIAAELIAAEVAEPDLPARSGRR